MQILTCLHSEGFLVVRSINSNIHFLQFNSFLDQIFREDSNQIPRIGDFVVLPINLVKNRCKAL